MTGGGRVNEDRAANHTSDHLLRQTRNLNIDVGRFS
jgi:hypothetical protein